MALGPTGGYGDPPYGCKKTPFCSKEILLSFHLRQLNSKHFAKSMGHHLEWVILNLETIFFTIAPDQEKP
jgi:hypothetical protein